MRLKTTSFSFVLLLCAVTLAHPVSHTDAWVKVSDTSVSVRLLVFLDDVVRHQSDPGSEATHISSSAVQLAIQQHSATLLNQLQIFDQNGRPLASSILSEPSWQPSSGTVDLASDSTVKLKWSLLFEVSGEPLSSLTFLHQMTHSSLPVPGELRLHLQHTKSGRRIDAVIAPDRPHTILLPSKTQDSAATVLNPNLAVSRIIIAPTGIAHEFTAPLILLDAAWPASEQVQKVAAAAHLGAAATLSPQDAQEVRERVIDWFQNQTTLAINGQPVTQTSIYVDFLPSERIAIAGPEPVIAVEETNAVPVMGTQVGVQLRYPGMGDLQSLELVFRSNPGPFSELTAEVVSAKAQVSELVEFSSEAPSQPFAVADSLTFRWQADSPGTAVSESTGYPALNADGSHAVPQDSSTPDSAAAVSPITVHSIWPSLWGLRLAGIMLLMITMGCTVARLLITGTWPWRISGLGVLVAVIIAGSVHERHVVVDEAQAEQLIQGLLHQVYVASMQPAETVAVTQLSQVLHADLVEQVYLETLQSLSTSAEDGLLIDIQAVELQSQHVRGVPETQDRFTSTCEWRVRGRIHHWGHTHARELLLRGRVGFYEDQGRWKIRAVEQLETDAVSGNPRKIPS